MNKAFYDIPMMFSAPLVLANLAGRKTQTRRMPTAILNKAFEAYEAGRPVRLWQREAFRTEIEISCGKEWDVVHYKASSPYSKPEYDVMKYKPSIHMPRKFSRFTGLNVHIRKERVQLINDADALREGPTVYDKCLPHMYSFGDLTPLLSPKEAFAGIWEHLHGNNPKKPGEGWADNPEVYVVSYTGLNGNIDAPQPSGSETDCETCRGDGVYYPFGAANPCPDCKGAGKQPSVNGGENEG